MGQTAASRRGPDGSGAGGEDVGWEGGRAYAIVCLWWEQGDDSQCLRPLMGEVVGGSVADRAEVCYSLSRPCPSSS